MKAKGVVSLTATIVLCLPSLVGGPALLTNLVLQRHLEDWGQGSTASVALGVFIGGPLVAIATMMGVIVALRPIVSRSIKAAHLIIVGFGAAATISLSLLFHLARR